MGLFKDFYRMLFDKTPIEAGQKYRFAGEDIRNPFKDLYNNVEVKDVKNGYVSFRHCGDSIFQNESLEVKHFRFNYMVVNNG